MSKKLVPAIEISSHMQERKTIKVSFEEFKGKDSSFIVRE